MLDRRELRILERLQQAFGVDDIAAAHAQAHHALLLRTEPLRALGETPARPSQRAGVIETANDGGHERMTLMARSDTF
jgi:hypothetical protein